MTVERAFLFCCALNKKSVLLILSRGKKREKICGRQEAGDEQGQHPTREKPFPDTLIHRPDCRRAS